MLPPLSNKLGSNLQLLVPVTITPSIVSARRNALLELKKVDAVQVRRAGNDKKDWFVVEVFADSASSDPTSTDNEGVQDDARLRRPTVRIERTLLEFVDLRNKVYNIVHDAHRSEPCEFCAGFMDQVVFGANPDGFLVGLFGGKRLARTVEKFVEEILSLTVQHTSIDARGCCSGQTTVPQIVHAFLFNAANEAA
ncbi:hypothetical protein F441_17993 [Phytophthora nicotianae CJ01A1]|uniref:Uncharacterized protein n=6 Tax=Phytophthora nicotianae TaxID=4792 RepID=W2PPV1_PHYN3|nr:hypothetical protein PPTG_16717 [Phytophthora nicotianae INRA-310]ETI35576.1 hypothetical protein F443_18112 [Phytophthora nicotianae P1569]ETK75831.1 hypothetical protein L915_17627 [Phytophthora nicotianae]ETO64319.1 hypothetical protein F444_18133 [Phytophthora nicotianae P1976]ETP05395.1 hypothetical protein F441_17993 [Phytophthora nicotianae CJ01A1]ETP33533.1 hypothetical protein F442_17955 [Phytophthora nicotianae P10297]KUF99409.1 hypothetical protein AM587_10008802 [Phytophthora n